jgi:hypothetical protein
MPKKPEQEDLNPSLTQAPQKSGPTHLHLKLCAKKEQQTEMERSSKVDFFAAMSKL